MLKATRGSFRIGCRAGEDTERHSDNPPERFFSQRLSFYAALCACANFSSRFLTTVQLQFHNTGCGGLTLNDKTTRTAGRST